jgi:hypothetical protein
LCLCSVSTSAVGGRSLKLKWDDDRVFGESELLEPLK